VTQVERQAWIAFISVVTKFLGNDTDPDYVTIVANVLEKYKFFRCLMSLKIHFLNLYLDFFPQNLGAVSEKQGEHYHHDIRKQKEDTRVGGMLTHCSPVFFPLYLS
jgi:hypothetical protein